MEIKVDSSNLKFQAFLKFIIFYLFVAFSKSYFFYSLLSLNLSWNIGFLWFFTLPVHLADFGFNLHKCVRQFLIVNLSLSLSLSHTHTHTHIILQVLFIQRTLIKIPCEPIGRRNTKLRVLPHWPQPKTGRSITSQLIQTKWSLPGSS